MKKKTKKTSKRVMREDMTTVWIKKKSRDKAEKIRVRLSLSRVGVVLERAIDYFYRTGNLEELR